MKKFFTRILFYLLKEKHNKSSFIIENSATAGLFANQKVKLSCLSFNFYVSNTDSQSTLICPNLHQQNIEQLSSVLTKSAGGFTIKNAIGYYENLDGNIMSEGTTIFEVDFFEVPSTQKIETIFRTFFSIARNTSQESVLLSINKQKILIYL